MRAINIRPAALRRNSTSLTLRSNLAAGLYDAWAGRDARPVAMGTPAALNADTFLRKLRRPREYWSMQASLGADCKRLAHQGGILQLSTSRRVNPYKKYQESRPTS